MNDTNHQIIKLLIEVGLSAVIAEELSEKIEDIYREANRQVLRERGRKGGRPKVLKGTVKLKATDPVKYQKTLENRSIAAKKREANKKVD